MPTENRSSNTEMVSVPRDLLERLDLGKDTATALATLPELRAILANPAEQHQTEPAAWYDPQHQDFLTAEGRAATLRMGDGDRLARYSVRLFAAPTAAEELDSVRHWRGKHADVMRERDTLRAQLTKQEELLGAIAGWTSETRAVVLEAFQDELNESASYAWYDAAIADLMALVGALSHSAEPVVRDHEIPGTSFLRLNMQANQGE